jgi:hypothetical protein
MLRKAPGVEVIARFRHEVGAVDSPTEWSVDEALARRIVRDLPSVERLKGAMACMYVAKIRWNLYKIRWNLRPASERLRKAVDDVLRQTLGPTEYDRFSVDTPPARVGQLDRPLPPLGGKVKATFWANLLGKADHGLAITTHQSGWHAAELAPRSAAHLISELLRGRDAVERKSVCLGLQVAKGFEWAKQPGPREWTALIQVAGYRCLWWDNADELGEKWRMAPGR